MIDYIQNSIVDIDLGDIVIDFNIYKQRQSMVKSIKIYKRFRFYKIIYGDENKFAENIENDVLYEVTGASKYFVRNFTSDISDCNLYTDIYERKNN